MNAEHTFIGWRFGLWWVLLTVAGLIIGIPLGCVLVAIAGWIIGVPEGSDSILLKLGLDNAALFICIVAAVGLMQWLTLRRIVRRAGFWVPASIIGFTISSSIHGVVCHVYGYPDDLGPLGAQVWTLFFILGGTLTGLLQQRILRHQVRRSGWWVPASAAGWGLVVIGFGIVSKILGVRLQVVGEIASSGLLGIVTGVTLIWLLRQPTQQASDTTT
jgi:hypothetical protein